MEGNMGDIDEQTLFATIYEVVGRLDTTNENLAAINKKLEQMRELLVDIDGNTSA